MHRRALGVMHQCNTLTGCPLAAIMGLSLYDKDIKEKYKKEVTRNLKSGLEFCHAFVGIDSVSEEEFFKDKKLNSEGGYDDRFTVYWGLQDYSSKEDRDEFREGIVNAKRTMEKILNEEPVNEQAVEASRKALRKVYCFIKGKVDYDVHVATSVVIGRRTF